MALKCIVVLGVPDAIHRHQGPTSLSDLASSLPLPLPLHHSKVDALRRLMRPLVHAGFFTATDKADHEQLGGEEEEGEDHYYSLTTMGKLLLPGGSLSPFIDLHLDPKMMAQWGMLSSWFLYSSDPVPFEMVRDGMSFWEWLEKAPDQKKAFRGVMIEDSKLVARVLVSECREVFEESWVESLVDVGGGGGTMAVEIAKTFPKLKCTVFDLPRVVANLKEGDGVKGLENLEVVGGSMFEKVPPADIVLLKLILHDWDDEKCLEILKCCREAVSQDDKKKGKVIVIDMVMGHKAVLENHELCQVQYCFDLLMLVHFNGKERNEKEWQSLFMAAGFSDYKIIRSLGPKCLIEAYP
ncbi:unnamed protein product [Linum tenue]|uniref:Uncharacterized protein n=1 Tax=Linum tenue TaxID=586396 RepID=A0AAV0IUY5_9ROSI|nr:unnamed protein product [Linum tenue]